MLDLDRIRGLLAARKPGYSLPQAFYKDPEIFAFDLAAIHARSWIMVGFDIELPERGSYLALAIGESPIIVLRDRDGVLRGFHNACRHRGAQICENGRGQANRLLCPYHQWTYDLTGRLVRANRMGDDFDPARHGLKPIHVESIAGTIQVCLADEPPDIATFRAELTPLLAPHRLHEAKLAHESVLVERANWKLVMENARECYHCAARHPELSLTFPVKSSRHFDFGSNPILQQFNARMAARGLPVGPVEEDWWQAMRFPLNAGCVSLSMDGQPCVARPMVGGDPDIGSLRWALEPHTFCHAVGDQVFMFSAMPVGPQETIVTSKWLVHRDAEPGVDYDVDKLIELWTTTNLQDRDLAENNQRGVNGLGYIPGPYSEEAEALVLRFVDWYCAKARSYLDAPARRERAA
jgi:glycine betaine catabolism A